MQIKRTPRRIAGRIHQAYADRSQYAYRRRKYRRLPAATRQFVPMTYGDIEADIGGNHGTSMRSVIKYWPCFALRLGMI